MLNEFRLHNINYPKSRQQWFSVCIFPLRQLNSLKGNRSQSASAGSLNVMPKLKKRRDIDETLTNFDLLKYFIDKYENSLFFNYYSLIDNFD